MKPSAYRRTAPVITTDSSAISSTFDSQQVLELPTNYRGAGSTSPLRLLAYQPGIQSDNGYNFALQGGLPSQTQVSLDGISTVSAASNSPLSQLFPSAESIAEMKVQGVGNNAEFGQVGDITTTSRGGSNEFHGSAFDYLQNRAFDATAFGSVTKPQKTANDFGGSLAALSSGTARSSSQPSKICSTARALPCKLTVPTAAMRNGDFSNEKVGPVGSAQPTTSLPQQANPSTLNPVATKVLQLLSSCPTSALPLTSSPPTTAPMRRTPPRPGSTMPASTRCSPTSSPSSAD